MTIYGLWQHKCLALGSQKQSIIRSSRKGMCFLSTLLEVFNIHVQRINLFFFSCLWILFKVLTFPLTSIVLTFYFFHSSYSSYTILLFICLLDYITPALDNHSVVLNSLSPCYYLVWLLTEVSEGQKCHNDSPLAVSCGAFEGKVCSPSVHHLKGQSKHRGEHILGAVDTEASFCGKE